MKVADTTSGLPLAGMRERAASLPPAPSSSPDRVKPRFLSLQAGRGLAALMVVCCHAAVYTGEDPRYWHHILINTRLAGATLGVEYFFVLSGLVILMAHWKELGQAGATRRYLAKRFRRVYPIYWIVLTVVVTEYLLRPSMGAAYQRSPWVILSGVLLVHIKTLDANLPVAWTLFHEVLFYLVFASLLLFQRAGWWIGGVWCALSLAMLVHPLGAYLSDYLFSPLHLLFALGMLVAYVLRRGLSAPGYAALVPGVLIFAYTLFWAGQRGYASIFVQLLAGFGSALIILGAAVLEQERRLVVPSFFNRLGDASYSIYLVHYPVMMAAAPLVYKAWLHARVPILIPFLALVAMAAAAGWLMHVYLEKPLLNRWPRPRATRSTYAAIHSTTIKDQPPRTFR